MSRGGRGRMDRMNLKGRLGMGRSGGVYSVGAPTVGAGRVGR